MIMNRVKSPNLDIYKPQFTSLLSVGNRIIGVFLSFFFLLWLLLNNSFLINLLFNNSIFMTLLSAFYIFHLLIAVRRFIWNNNTYVRLQEISINTYMILFTSSITILTLIIIYSGIPGLSF